MSVEEALVTHLTTHPGLSALVGDRVEPLQLSLKSPLPAITFQRVSRMATKHRSSRRANHSRSRFQFDVWGATYEQVITIRDLFFDAMATFAQISDPRVDVALIQDDRDAYEAEPGRWRAIVDYYIWHTEA